MVKDWVRDRYGTGMVQGEVERGNGEVRDRYRRGTGCLRDYKGF